jgi:cytochrome c-type biogenesis protein
MAEVTIALAFLAGVISFLSPCVLPLIPAYLTYLAGTTLKSEYTLKNRTRIFLNSVSFVLGFSVVFSLLAVLLQSILSEVAYEAQTYLGYLGGIIIIIFGLQLTGIIQLSVLARPYRLNIKSTNISYLTSFIFGAAFAIGWTPCVGAALGAILTLAVTRFLLVGAFISRSTNAIKVLSPYLKWLSIVFGVILIILGILVFTGSLRLIANVEFLNEILLG